MQIHGLLAWSASHQQGISSGSFDFSELNGWKLVVVGQKDICGSRLFVIWRFDGFKGSSATTAFQVSSSAVYLNLGNVLFRESCYHMFRLSLVCDETRQQRVISGIGAVYLAVVCRTCRTSFDCPPCRSTAVTGHGLQKCTTM